jgi:hypothetical protein
MGENSRTEDRGTCRRGGYWRVGESLPLILAAGPIVLVVVIVLDAGSGRASLEGSRTEGTEAFGTDPV